MFQGVSRCFLYLFSKRGLEQSIAVTTHGSIWEVFLAQPNDPIIILTPNQSRGLRETPPEHPKIASVFNSRILAAVCFGFPLLIKKNHF